MNIKLKILVSQLGARHRYLIPIILQKNDVLGYLFTDSSKYSIAGRISTLVNKIMNNHFKLFYRLAKRDPKLPKEKVKTFDTLLLNKVLLKKKLSKYEIMYQSLSKSFIKKETNDCNVLYSMFFENIDFVRHCKSKGMTIVIDIYENPFGFKLLKNEIESHNEFNVFDNLKTDYLEKDKFRNKYVEEVLGLADYYTLPSRYVEKNMLNYKNFDIRKSKIIPYPSSITVNNYNYRPIKHRLVWVGNDVVRKGLIYCAKAATILRNKYSDLEFIVAGSIPNEIIVNSTFKDLKFVGVCNKEELIELFETSEAYVFPTLFEGFAGTVIEAASCGCPIITTENSGIDVNSFPAIIIKEKNVREIVEAVENLFENNDFKNQLSYNVFDYAKNLSPTIYEKHLIEFFKSINVKNTII